MQQLKIILNIIFESWSLCQNFSENNFIHLHLPSLRYKYNFIRLTSVTGTVCRNRFTIFQDLETRNCRACDRMSKIAYRVCSYARDLRWQYIFRWRVSNTVLTNSMRVRTHAHIHPRCLSDEIPKRADAMLFMSGKKLLKRIEELQTRSEMLVYCVSDNTLFLLEKKLTRAYVYNREWETRHRAEKQIEDKVLVLWKEALNLGSCYAPTDFELI